MFFKIGRDLFERLHFSSFSCYNKTTMKKFLTDVHTHTFFSPDGRDTIEVMLAAAKAAGVDFYGVSEHIDYDLQAYGVPAYGKGSFTDEAEYFHHARHIQEDYEGAMNVLIGVEMGYTDHPNARAEYAALIKKYSPDFVVNSVHTRFGWDYSREKPFYRENADGTRTLLSKTEVYNDYLATVRRSVEQTDYDFDIVGHAGYCMRYAPYEDSTMSVAEFQEGWDGVLSAIIKRGKILEINSSNRGGNFPFLPTVDVLKRYYELGGRKVSFGSDSHFKERILEKRELVVSALKEIGFTHITVPCRGEHIKVEI